MASRHLSPRHRCKLCAWRPVEPGKPETNPNEKRLVSTYTVLSAGGMVPAERAGFKALESHMKKELGLELPEKSTKAKLLDILEGVLQTRERAKGS